MTKTIERLHEFLVESNRIEGIYIEPTAAVASSCMTFLAESEIRLTNLVIMTNILEPTARLRLLHDMNVVVGEHTAPQGGPRIEEMTKSLLKRISDDKYLRTERTLSISGYIPSQTEMEGQAGFCGFGIWEE